VTNTTNPGFEYLVSSSISMLERPLTIYERGRAACAPAVWKRLKYVIMHGFFYHIEHELPDFRVYASEAALDYAADHWVGGSESLWSLRRDDQDKQERDENGKYVSIFKSGLHWEHIYTGGMFFADLLELFREGGGRLDPARLQALILDNMACAWVTREENRQLPKSRRGRGLGDALEAYRTAGIRLRPRPTHLDGEG
jgi:hypothetical protein